jgi:copper oxidase (laccase) domain-containing protein
MFTVKEQNGVTVVSCKTVELAFSGIVLGNVDYRFSEGEEVELCRKRLLAAVDAVDIPAYTVQTVQMKPSYIDLHILGVQIDEIKPSYSTDGMFTKSSKVMLGLNTADCVAMAIFNAKAPSVLGLIHAGRQGVSGGIHLFALSHLMNRYRVPVEDVGIIIAPSVGPNSYIFDGLPNQLLDRRWEPHIENRNNLHHVNVLGRLVRELVTVGVVPEQMYISEIDVGAANSGYFSHSRSHRTGEPQGRNGVIARLKT